MSYGKIGLTTVAVTHDLLSGMPLVLFRKELIRLWNSILPEPGQPSALTFQTNMLHCMQEDQAYSKPVVRDSLYPMISSLLRHAQGQMLAEFLSPQATGGKHMRVYFINIK